MTKYQQNGQNTFTNYKSTRSNKDFRGKIMTKWECISNKRSHSYLSYSRSRSVPITLSNLVSIPMSKN